MNPRETIKILIGEILKEEFMIPLGLSANRLAGDIGVSESYIDDLLNNKSRITPELSLRLSRYFGVSEKYFLRIQNEIDIRKVRETMGDSISKIVPLSI